MELIFQSLSGRVYVNLPEGITQPSLFEKKQHMVISTPDE